MPSRMTPARLQGPVPDEQPRGPHVVMLVRNGFTHDSRVENEARTLRDAGYCVTVVCEWRPGLALREDRNGVEVRRIPRRHPRIRLLRFLSYRADLIRALHQAKPTVLHAHDANALDEVGTVAATGRIPFVYDSHELWLGRTRHKHSRLYHSLMQTWYRVVERRRIPHARAVLTFAFARRIYPLDLDAGRLVLVIVLCAAGSIAARLADGAPGEIIRPALAHGVIVAAVGAAIWWIVRGPVNVLRMDAARTARDRLEVSAPTGTTPA